jgi:hypothetical protein
VHTNEHNGIVHTNEHNGIVHTNEHNGIVHTNEHNGIVQLMSTCFAYEHLLTLALLMSTSSHSLCL